jgi:hypothetical protein
MEAKQHHQQQNDAELHDVEVALQLHKELNAVKLRARRGHEADLAHQQSLDRFRRELAAKPRSKRTNSSSQDHAPGGGGGGRKRRTSDPEEHGGHTSARRRHGGKHDTSGTEQRW